MYRAVTLYESVIALLSDYYQMITNSAVNRSVACLINN